MRHTRIYVVHLNLDTSTSKYRRIILSNLSYNISLLIGEQLGISLLIGENTSLTLWD
jgi:hypothetical protein